MLICAIHRAECPERESHCTNRHEQCKQRKGEYFRKFVKKSGKATIVFQKPPQEFDFMSA